MFLAVGIIIAILVGLIILIIFLADLLVYFGALQQRNISSSTELAAKDGKTGKVGRNGRDGRDGRNGRDGTNGKDGANGKPGQDGKPGKPGKNGREGKPGKPGKNGKDGAPGAPGRTYTSSEAPSSSYHTTSCITMKSSSNITYYVTQSFTHKDEERSISYTYDVDDTTDYSSIVLCEKINQMERVIWISDPIPSSNITVMITGDYTYRLTKSPNPNLAKIVTSKMFKRDMKGGNFTLFGERYVVSDSK